MFYSALFLTVIAAVQMSKLGAPLNVCKVQKKKSFNFRTVYP